MPSSSAAAATSPAPAGGVQTTIRPHAGCLRRDGAHDERRDETARHIDPDRVERQPAALEQHARLHLKRDVGRALRLVPAADAVGEREQRLARQRLGVAAARAAGSAPSNSSAHSRTAARRALDVGDDRHADHPLDRDDEDRRGARGLQSRQQPPDLGGRGRARARRPFRPPPAAARSGSAAARARRRAASDASGALNIR